MAPFPETEIMTIKRLQVALRRMDFKLLKDGAYKLHEKYHGGFKFEYLDLLREIYLQVTNNSSIPEDIKDILCPTINDILSGNNSEQNMGYQKRVSNLTQMSYNSSFNDSGVAVEEKEENTSKISAFDVFSAPRNHEDTVENSYTTKPINTVIQNEITNTEQSVATEEKAPEIQSTVLESVSEKNYIPLKTIAIYYGQDNSKEKTKNILQYKEMISKFSDEHYSISQVLKLISEINIQSDTNVSELKNIIDQIKINGNKLNLITNSSSRELIDLFENEEYPYSLYSETQDKQMTLIPVFGLTNQFICSNCREEYLDRNNPVKPLVIECPKCKNPMFPNFYGANNKNMQINMNYYNNALVSLANSKVWVLIHPTTENNLLYAMLLNAFRLNKEIENIYILEKDINTREAFRAAFFSINDKVNINIQMTALEDFINSLK